MHTDKNTRVKGVTPTEIYILVAEQEDGEPSVLGAYTDHADAEAARERVLDSGDYGDRPDQTEVWTSEGWAIEVQVAALWGTP